MALPPLYRRSGKSSSNIKQSRDLILREEDYSTDTSFNSKLYPEIPSPSAPIDESKLSDHDRRIKDLEDKVEYLVRFIRHMEYEFSNIINKEINRGVDIKDQPGDPYGNYEEYIKRMDKARGDYNDKFNHFKV
jgi:hypothetical protein